MMHKTPFFFIPKAHKVSTTILTATHRVILSWQTICKNTVTISVQRTPTTITSNIIWRSWNMGSFEGNVKYMFCLIEFLKCVLQKLEFSLSFFLSLQLSMNVITKGLKKYYKYILYISLNIYCISLTL